MMKWYDESGFLDDVVISTRVRLARNINGYPFPRRLTKDRSCELMDKISKALYDTGYGFEEKDLSKTNDLEKNFLLEEYTISKNMLDNSICRKVFLGADGHVSIMANEEDHLRLQCIYAGFETDKAYELIDKLDDLISQNLDYAFSDKYGYKTACPTNTGTGLRVSYMLHLPALHMTGRLDELFNAIGKLGIAVRGIYGEGSKSSGHIYQISNQVTLGLSEREITDKLSDVVNQIIKKEKDVRNKILKENGETDADKIMRSYGVLKFARLMSGSELLKLWSNVRLGISAGLIGDMKISSTTKMLINSRPAHVMMTEKRLMGESERDKVRARLLQDIMKEE